VRRVVSLAIALTVVIAVIIVENVAIAAFFPHLPRLTTDFSAAYFTREIKSMKQSTPQTLFLGDSVLWGYRIRGDQTAVSILTSQGCTCRNLAFKSGNPPNDYFLTRLLLDAGVHPRAVVLDVNQAVLNQSSDYYQTLHPAVATLAKRFLTPQDRATLTIPFRDNAFHERLDTVLSSISQVYAMRSDIRATLLGDTAAAPLPKLNPDVFAGTYDLLPLDNGNVGVRFLEATVETWRRAGVPVLAFMTPTNHELLHKYIDNAHYRANVSFLVKELSSRGARVIDLDRGFAANEFLDNAHLTAAGQRRLAAKLEPWLQSAGSRT